MNIKEIKQDIADLKLAIKSPATPADKKKLFEDKVAELEAKLKGSEKDDDDFYKAVSKKTGAESKVTKSKITSISKDKKKSGQALASFKVMDQAKDYVRKEVLAGKTLAQIRDTKKDFKGTDYSAEIQWTDMTESDPVIYLKLKNGDWSNVPLKEVIAEIKNEIVKSQDKSSEPQRKKSVPLKKSEVKDLEYDCDELIEKEKKRKANAKKRASMPKKSPATKNKEKLEDVFDDIKERAVKGDVTKAELGKLIAECKDLLKMLQDKYNKL